MPIIFKKDLHFGDSDDDRSNNAISSFLDDADDEIQSIEPPPAKKRKVGATPQKSDSSKQISNKPKKSKAMLKKQRIKKRKEKNKSKKSSNQNKINGNSPLISIESIQPKELAMRFQKLFMKTLEVSSKNLGILFKDSHFLPVSRDLDPIDNDVNFGSCDVLRLFLDSNYQTVSKEAEEKDGKQKDDESKDKKKEWNAYTKSMQVLIICPSVRKAVDTIKAIHSIRVNHSFFHKKQILKMTEEQWEEHKEAMDELSIIPLRICELFGKHRKIEYQRKELLSRSWHCGVGGINRINKLFESKHLNLKQCELIMIDLQKNAKNMSILDMPQMRKELCEWIKKYAFDRIDKGKLKIAVF